MSAFDHSNAKRRLPIGIQTFREIRREGHYYVDKTAYIRRMVDGGKHYFLSRPRRFGKSLLLDTIKDLFEGREELFRGLAIHDEWDWTPRPVLRISFGSGKVVDSASQGEALRQIKEKGYADMYRHLGQPIHLIGMEFSTAQRNIAAFEVERVA